MARRRFYRQAAMDALVRYGPEMSGLLELQRQAQQNLRSTVRSARGTARGIVAATDRARPEVRGVYSAAARQQGLTQAQVASHVSELGPISDPIKAAIAAEAGAASERISESRAASLTDLAQRRVSAQEGKQFAIQNARSQFATEIGQVLRRKQSLRGEMGAFQASTAGELREAARDRRLRLQLERIGQRGQNRRQQRQLSQQERNSLRSSGVDPSTGKPIPGGKLDPKVRAEKGKAKLTPLQQQRASDTVGDALHWAKQLKAAGLTGIEDARKALSEGRDPVKPQALHDPVTGKPVYNKDGTPKTTGGRAGVPQIDSQLLLAAALEEAYIGHVTKQTQAKLHRRGLSVRDLGLTRYRKRRYTMPSGSGGSDAAQG